MLGGAALVLTGAGRGFCAGADVGDIAAAASDGDLSPAALRHALRRRNLPLALALLGSDKPIVAAVRLRERRGRSLDREFTAQALCLASEDAVEGARSFMEKRSPRFAWR